MFIIVIIEYELRRESQSHHDFSFSLSLVKDLKEMTDHRLLFIQKQLLFINHLHVSLGTIKLI